jgi:hypothetical protein
VLLLPSRPLARAGLVVAAAVSYGLVWFALSSIASPPLAGMLPAFAMLMVPAALAGRARA